MSETSQFDMFESVFRPQVRVGVNWRALREENNRVLLRVVDDRDELGDLLAPWYSTGDALSRDRRRVSIAEAATLRHSSSSHRRQIIQLADAALARKPAAIALPAIQIAGSRILLDGTHRCTALYLSGVDFKILLYVLRTTKSGRAAIFDA